MSAAAELRRLAILLEAGIPAPRAWGYLAPDGSGVARAVAAVPPGDDLVPALLTVGRADADASAWAHAGAAWRVATTVGAPLAVTLTALSEDLDDVAETCREVDVALAGPRATSRVVLALPALGLATGSLLGLNPLGALLGTVPGTACLGVAAVLVFVARRWNRRLLAEARDVDPFAGSGLDLLAIALSGGAASDRALAIAGSALDEAALPPLDPSAAAVLDFARTAGVGAARLLRAEARDRRRDARAAGRRRAAELGTRLLLPLGVCILPAFVAVGVIPLLIAVLGTTSGI
jgi:tight adherence protein B